MRYDNRARMILSASMMLALTACSEIEGVDYLSLGHPADSDARSGKHERMSNSLEPELITVQPDVKAAEPAKAGSAAKSPKVMDHSMHGGGR